MKYLRRISIILILLLLLSLFGCGFSMENIPVLTPDGQTAAPSSTPSSTPADMTEPEKSIEPEPEIGESERSFSIVAAGDVMAHSDNLKAAYDENTGLYSFKENHIYVKNIVEKADMAIVNLETVTAGEAEKYTSFPLFNTPDTIVDALAYAGFDVVVTANNHALDRGIDGIRATYDKILETGLTPLGTNIQKGATSYKRDIEGATVSVLAYTQHINGNEPLLGEENRYMVNKLDHDAVIEDIKEAKSDSDLIILYLHWGVEYLREAEAWQREWAMDFFEAGADVILGTHPHVIRPDEVFQIDGEYKYVIYSMGNFISNFIREDNRKNALYTEDGVMLSMNFKIDETGAVRLDSVKPIPTWPYKFTDEDGLSYRIIPIGDPDEFSYDNGYAFNEALASWGRTMESLKGFTAP